MAAPPGQPRRTAQARSFPPWLVACVSKGALPLVSLPHTHTQTEKDKELGQKEKRARGRTNSNPLLQDELPSLSIISQPCSLLYALS